MIATNKVQGSLESAPGRKEHRLEQGRARQSRLEQERASKGVVGYLLQEAGQEGAMSRHSKGMINELTCYWELTTASNSMGWRVP